MRVIAKLLELAAPLKLDFCITIHNPPWQDLVIRDIRQPGPDGFGSISVAHSGICNGRSVRTPEMLFEVEQLITGMIFTPYCFRDQQENVEQYSVRCNGNRFRLDWKLQREHLSFARQWNASLEKQGFIDAFRRATFIEKLRREVDAELLTRTDGAQAELRHVFDRAICKTLGKRAVRCQ